MSQPNYRFVQVGTRPAPTATKVTNPNRMGRICPVDRSNVGAKLIIPFAIPWPLSSDQYGISYPAGTVGVLGGIGITGAGTFQAMMDDYISNNLWPVPGTLPGAYTARFMRGLASLNIDHTLAGTGSFGGWYRDSNGYQPYPIPANGYWQPQDSSANGGGVPIFSVSISYNGGLDTGSGNMSSCSIGCRNLKFLMGLFRSSGGAIGVGGTFSVEISHNADGTLPAIFTSASIIDYTHTWNESDLTTVSVSNPYNYITPEVDTGAFYPTTGVPTLYRIIVKPSAAVITAALSGTTCLVSRLDGKNSPQIIPFPYTCTGDGGLIAPGGVPS